MKLIKKYPRTVDLMIKIITRVIYVSTSIILSRLTQ